MAALMVEHLKVLMVEQLKFLTAPYSLNQRAKIGMPGSSIIQ